MKNNERFCRLFCIYILMLIVAKWYEGEKNHLDVHPHAYIAAEILVACLMFQGLIELMGWICAALGAKDGD